MRHAEAVITSKPIFVVWSSSRIGRKPAAVPGEHKPPTGGGQRHAKGETVIDGNNAAGMGEPQSNRAACREGIPSAAAKQPRCMQSHLGWARQQQRDNRTACCHRQLGSNKGRRAATSVAVSRLVVRKYRTAAGTT